MLKLIQGGKVRPWERQPEETEEEHRAFCLWCMQGDARPVKDTALARRMNWTDRATAFDQYTSAGRDPKEQLERTLANLMRVCAIESDKLVRDVAASSGRELTPKELAMTLTVVREQSKLARDLFGIDGELDLSELSDDELRDVQRVYRLVKKVRG